MSRRKIMELCMGLIVLAAAFFFGKEGGLMAASANIEKKVIVVDSGHGGSDPGKVGVNNALEKDINLAIAKNLEALLTKEGITVVMTRENENGLYEEGDSNKKQQDMKKRCAIIDQANPLFTVSIHQNSYTGASVHGPQVFYYSQSALGQEIAGYIQESMNSLLQVDKPREIKGNDSYYLLKKTKNPTLIVECGFLSNPDEASKLVTEEYQGQVAQAICAGVMKYVNGEAGK